MIKHKSRLLGPQRLWYWSTIGLAMIAVMYGFKGYYHLLVDLDGAVDFKGRWRELHYIYQGHYPHPMITSDSPYFDPSIGSASYGGYFPWSFFSLTAFVLPASLGFAKFYFGFVNLLSMVISSLFVYRRYSRHGKIKGLFGVISVLAIAANCTTLGVGQLGIILNVLLILFLLCLETKKLTLAGLLCGVSLLKPNVTALFFLIPIARKKYWVAVVSVLYTAVATGVIAIATHQNPIPLIILPFRGVTSFADKGDSLITVVTWLGGSVTWAVPLLVVASIGGCLLLFRWVSQFSLMTQFAIASLVGRLWTYHRVYDNVMLIFLYLALLDLTLEHPRRSHLFMLCLLGSSLWIPSGWFEALPPGLAYMIWIGALIFLLLRTTTGKATPVPAES